MSTEEALHAFRHDAPYLFLGAAFAAVGMVLLRLLFFAASATRSSSTSHCLPLCTASASGFGHRWFR